MDRVALFRTKPEYLDVWASDDYKRKQKELGPAAVRGLLGRDRFDTVYGALSEFGTHPTSQIVMARTSVRESVSDRPMFQIHLAGQRSEPLQMMFSSLGLYAVNRLLMEVVRSRRSSTSKKISMSGSTRNT